MCHSRLKLIVVDFTREDIYTPRIMNGEFYDYTRVAKLIEEYCEDHSIKEADYAALIEVHPGSLSRIKAGKMCSPETLARIAALSGVGLRSLISDRPLPVRRDLPITATV
jgi:hypothetical protein